MKRPTLSIIYNGRIYTFGPPTRRQKAAETAKRTWHSITWRFR